MKSGPKPYNTERDTTIIERYRKGEDPRSIAIEYKISWSRVMQILSAAAFKRGAVCEECNAPLRGKQVRFCGRRCVVLSMNRIIANNTEVAAKISATMKGRPNKYRGLHYSDQAQYNMSLAHIGKISPNKGKKTGKPAWNRGIQHKEKTKQKISHTKIFRSQGGWGEYGNGRPMPREHRGLLDILEPLGWVAEHAISLITKQDGYPTCYKVDLALVDRKLAIEIDGTSHNRRKYLDTKKDEKLNSLGWIVVRISTEKANHLVSVDPKTILSDLFNV